MQKKMTTYQRIRLTSGPLNSRLILSLPAESDLHVQLHRLPWWICFYEDCVIKESQQKDNLIRFVSSLLVTVRQLTKWEMDGDGTMKTREIWWRWDVVVNTSCMHSAQHVQGQGGSKGSSSSCVLTLEKYPRYFRNGLKITENILDKILNLTRNCAKRGVEWKKLWNFGQARFS